MVSAPEIRRAVVIEDDPDIRGLLVRVLVKQGFDVPEADAGLVGVEEVRRSQPDLITLDLNLPDLDGLEVCKLLREFSDAFIVMLTARADELDKLTGLDNGADEYISKPFSPRELQSRINALFRRRPSRAADSANRSELERATEVQQSHPHGPGLLQLLCNAVPCPPGRGVRNRQLCRRRAWACAAHPLRRHC